MPDAFDPVHLFRCSYGGPTLILRSVTLSAFPAKANVSASIKVTFNGSASTSVAVQSCIRERYCIRKGNKGCRIYGSRTRSRFLNRVTLAYDVASDTLTASPCDRLVSIYLPP